MSEQISTANWTMGRWSWLLQEFGIDPEHLVDSHGPCPICGGEDRFRFDNKDGRGTWICSFCGSGDGFDLIGKVSGMTFKDIAQQIDVMRPVAPDPSTEAFKPKVDVEKIRSKLNGTWQTARDPELLHEYLKNRGLTKVNALTDIRAVRELGFYDKKLGRATFPAIIALIRSPSGEPVSIHRTYLLPDNTRLKKIMPPTETITGGAIRLSPIVNGTLLVAEGIESALAGRQIYCSSQAMPREIGVWATISANGMRDLAIPPEIKTLVICADADKSFTGQASAYELARKVMMNKNIHDIDRVIVAQPSVPNDMADCLTHTRALQWIGSSIARE